jgi:hypothetical protein
MLKWAIISVMDESKERIDAGVRWEKRPETDGIQDAGSAAAESPVVA